MEAKPYLVIARKYRPQTFDEVIGQDHVSATLKNAISMNRIGHAYLFTGPRGVGKTSMARIFAKSLNCKNGPTATPCGKCQICLEIESSRALDVLEIDGASNRGIDEIRALRENVKFSPAGGKFKVYIIDEVHQITTDGFNALLKTLEEPPAHVKFIFATTSAHKVPATILSRCQRFDFRRIPTETIASTLREICRKEKIKVDEEALFAIARAADGSLRDSQSILDQIAASAGEGKIAKDDVVRSLGALEEDTLFDLMDALAAKDAKKALETLDRVLSEGKDPALFMERLLEHTRNLLFAHVSGELNALIDSSEAHKKRLAKQKELFTKDDLFYFFSVITHTLQIMKRFEMKRVPLEIALVKLAQKAKTEELSAVLEQLKSLEKKSLTAEPAARPSVIREPAKPAPKRPTAHAAQIEAREEPETEELPQEDLPVKPPHDQAAPSFDAVWNSLVQALKSEKISVASYLAEGEPIGYSAGVAKIAFPQSLDFHRETLEGVDNKKLIEKHLSSLLGQSVRVDFVRVKELTGRVLPGSPAEPEISPESENVIKSAMNIFGGRVIKD